MTGPPRPLPDPPTRPQHPWVLPLVLVMSACTLIALAALAVS